MTSPEGLLGGRRVAELLREHGVRPKKELGQNFVVDPNTIRKMVHLARLEPNDRVLEIGAGIGSLTLGLAPAVTHVTALEFDRDLVSILKGVVSEKENVTVVAADALRWDLSSAGATKLVANLPYNIAASVVLRVLEEVPSVSEMTVMTQKEVGQRLVAGPGSKAYGQASVLVRYFSQARIAASVSRRAFYPVPGVDSVVVRIARRSSPYTVNKEMLFSVVKSAFSQRRKMLRNTLAALIGSPSEAEALLTRAGVAPTARAEEIDLDGYVAIVEAVE